MGVVTEDPLRAGQKLTQDLFAVSCVGLYKYKYFKSFVIASLGSPQIFPA